MMDSGSCDCGVDDGGGGEKPPGNSISRVSSSDHGKSSQAPWLALLDIGAMLKKDSATNDRSSTTCCSFIAEFLKQVYRNKGTLPLDVFVSSQYYADVDRTDRTIFVSEKQPEGDMLVFGLFVEEHGARAKDPNCLYIQYLEKSGLADSKCIRKPSIVTATMVAYMYFVSLSGPVRVHIWADPPDEDYPDYVFYDGHCNTPVSSGKSDSDLTGMYKYIAAQGGWSHAPYDFKVAIPAMPKFNEEECVHDPHHADVKHKPHVAAMIEELRRTVALMTAQINAELHTTVIVDVVQRFAAVDVSPRELIPGFMKRRSVLVPEFSFANAELGRRSSAALINLMRQSAHVECATTMDVKTSWKQIQESEAMVMLPASLVSRLLLAVPASFAYIGMCGLAAAAPGNMSWVPVYSTAPVAQPLESAAYKEMAGYVQQLMTQCSKLRGTVPVEFTGMAHRLSHGEFVDSFVPDVVKVAEPRVSALPAKAIDSWPHASWSHIPAALAT